MSDNIDDFQFLERMNKNLKDEVILLKDENKDLKDEVFILKGKNKDLMNEAILLKDENIDLKDENNDLKDQTAHLSAENKKLQDANKDLVDKVSDLEHKDDDLDRANQTRIVRKEGEDEERKRLADLANQSTASRLPVLQQRTHFSKEKTGKRNTGANSSRLLSARKFGFQHQPVAKDCTITATPSAPTNNNSVQLPPITPADEKSRPGGEKAVKRFEDGVFHRGRKLVLPDIDNSTGGLVPKPPSGLSDSRRGRKLVLPDIDNSTGGLVPKPPSGLSDSRRSKPTHVVVTGSSFTPRPPASKPKKSEFVFKRPTSKMAVPRGQQQQQETSSNSDSNRSTPVLVPRPPARQVKKAAFVFQRANEKLAVPRSKPAAAPKPVIVNRPAPETTEFVFKRVTSPVAAPRSVPNRNA